jgi:peptidoglycan/LPS O-acetylase OafA/YrhL
MGLLAGASNAVLAVAITLGLIGLFQRHMSRRGPVGRYLSEASYWIYLIHYPIVIAAGGILALTDWPAVLKYVAVIVLALPLILGSHALLVRRGPLASILAGSSPATTR